ncbi:MULTISPECIES: hypothetical protein [Planktothricoides]|uniref:Uncharacterized protein n=2 Tax=Planktothricoides raciborskii TaxID=132608 RepID=A0AAU8JKG0_9CYAN|nr:MULTISPECIES: hypothetical protein [Planktothricoides]MBD2547412.1 hypothetical protein [Planktothricoides raciborskii FACHB-1370]MBD2584542.1 hypothetical protein [Planktothricoides raciborskii FACHB-1261]
MPKITLISTEETRFLGGLRGLRNRVSFFDAKDNFDFHRRNPVSGVSGLSWAVYKIIYEDSDYDR